MPANPSDLPSSWAPRANTGEPQRPPVPLRQWSRSLAQSGAAARGRAPCSAACQPEPPQLGGRAAGCESPEATRVTANDWELSLPLSPLHARLTLAESFSRFASSIHSKEKRARKRAAGCRLRLRAEAAY